MRSQVVIEYQFSGVDPEERRAILGGTLRGLIGVEVPTPA
jgi:hypothetical protein